MFCFKCGTEVPNGSKFCEKCGASLTDGNVTQLPEGESAKAGQQPVGIPTDVPKTKKRKKWPFILGGAVLLFLLIIIIAIGGGDEPENQSVSSSTEVNLSETCTNDEEGFTFKYPSAWKPVSEERIDIGETQVIDNDYGNLKVTLDYAEFSSRNENTYVAGEYVYPDEGNVFLNVVFTVENIGKKSGSMLSAWSKVLYDGEYEFSMKYEEGESTTDIPPLTSPVTSMLIFEVPKEVMETDKTLAIYLDENYVNDDTVLSFTIRTGSSASDEEVNYTGNFEENDDGQEEIEASNAQLSSEDIAGSYAGTDGTTICSLSMYSSPEGTAVGSAIVTYQGQEYSGEVTELATNLYQFVTADGTIVKFGMHVSVRGPWMQMSINGEIIELDMTEQYIS